MASKQPDAGYLTRRLVDVAQDVVINEEDCGTLRGISICIKDNEDIIEPLSDRIIGRTSLHDVWPGFWWNWSFHAGEEITTDAAESVGKKQDWNRSWNPFCTYLRKKAVCVKCYGKNLFRYAGTAWWCRWYHSCTVNRWTWYTALPSVHSTGGVLEASVESSLHAKFDGKSVRWFTVTGR